MEGWIKLHRKLCDTDLWKCEPFTRGQAWVDLILLANYETGFIYVRDHKIEVKRGQVGWSENRLSDRWKWSRTKVRKFLKDLEKEQQIIQHKSNSYGIITLIKYETYQEKEQQKNNSKTTEEQQKDTKKKNKEEEENIYAVFLGVFNKQTGKRFRGDKASRLNLKARVKDGYSIDEIEKAIINCKNDKFHKENTQYLTPEFITRSDKLEKYLYVGTEPQKRKVLV